MAKVEKLPANQFDHFYKGGNRIGALRHGPGGPMRPEEWLGSTTTRFGEKVQGLTKLNNGEFLKDAINREPESWLGREHLAAFGNSTEILVKLLDPDQRLPVHYHPNRAFAKDHLSLNHGKTEAWIVIEADVGAQVGLGFKREHTKSEIASWVENRNSLALRESLHRFDVRAGDAIFVPSGVPHNIDAGILVLELQEPTDLSALLEWEGFATDGAVDGHLGLGFDTVLDALRYSPLTASEIEAVTTKQRLFGEKSVAIFNNSADPYFRAHYLANDGKQVEAGFGILLITDGTGAIDLVDSKIDVRKGDAFVIPWEVGPWRLTGALGVVCRPPLQVDSSRAI